jgi:hypothetical protein
MQIQQCGILVGRLGRRGFIRGLLHYRLRLSCWGRRWRFIRRLLDVLNLRVVLSKSHLINPTIVPQAQFVSLETHGSTRVVSL